MDPLAIPPVAFLFSLLFDAVTGLAALIAPLAGVQAAALAIVIMTLIVRTALLPVSIAQVRAEGARRRLTPRLQALQRRHTRQPERLQRETMQLYRDEGVSPLAGIGPTVLQLPVVALVYGLFIQSRIGERPNTLLTETLGGMALGDSLAVAVIANPELSAVVIAVVLLALSALAAAATRWMMLRMQLPAPEGGPIGPSAMAALSWLPFATVIVVIVAPLAAALYIVTTMLWSLAERPLLRRILWSDAERHPFAPDARPA